MQGFDPMDAAQDEALIDHKLGEFRQLVELLGNVVKGLMDRVDALEKVVIEDLIGGIANEGHRIKRGKIGGEIRAKYADLEKYGGPYKQLFDKDIYDDVLETVYPQMQEAGFAEGKLDELMKGILGQYAERFKGIVPESAPAAVEVEIKQEGPEETEDDDLADVSPSVAELIRAKRRAGKN